jgi:BirA family biotin operon repressor/biotin-[acetyl-CoA-carboxylase] ligase
MNQRQKRATRRDVALPVRGRAVEVLGFLRRGAGKFVSGAEVSRTLGISRTAVWKHIGTLRDAGYVIEAHPSRGYRLLEVPDLLIPAELQRKRIDHLLSTDSTNRAAHDLAAQGAPEGTAVIAEEQTRGRGRLGRGWYSPPRVNIYVSIILRPSIALASVPQLTLVGAVATVRAITAVYEGPPELRPRIKWPNDILIGSRKVSGTLVETTTVGETLQHVILGVGINVNLRATRSRGRRSARGSSSSSSLATIDSSGRGSASSPRSTPRCPICGEEGCASRSPRGRSRGWPRGSIRTGPSGFARRTGRSGESWRGTCSS